MTPKQREREYRALDLVPDQNGYIVRGHASTFEPYELWSDGNVTYYERVGRGAYDGCDMSDVVFRIDHTGPVYARESAGTLSVAVDQTGLAFEADLSKTTRSKEVFEDLQAGNYPKASFAFVVEADHYEADTHTRVIDAFRKIYDVSPTTWAANGSTDIVTSARDYFTAQEEMIRKLADDEKRKRLLLRMKLG